MDILSIIIATTGTIRKGQILLTTKNLSTYNKSILFFWLLICVSFLNWPTNLPNLQNLNPPLNERPFFMVGIYYSRGHQVTSVQF